MTGARSHSELLSSVAPADEPGAARLIENLFQRYHHSLIQFLIRRLNGDRDRAADIAQDTYAKLVDYMSTGQGQAVAAETQASRLRHPKAFLFSVARHLVIDQFRRDRLRSNDGMVSIDEIEIAADSPGQEDILSGKRDLAVLEAAVINLPPRCREVFLLSRFQGLSHQDISKRLNLSSSMVEKHIARAMRDIRHAVKGVPKEDGHAGEMPSVRLKNDGR
jgi:RNA polymerase sigma factor (sigma-70 family)